MDPAAAAACWQKLLDAVARCQGCLVAQVAGLNRDAWEQSLAPVQAARRHVELCWLGQAGTDLGGAARQALVCDAPARDLAMAGLRRTLPAVEAAGCDPFNVVSLAALPMAATTDVDRPAASAWLLAVQTVSHSAAGVYDLPLDECLPQRAPLAVAVGLVELLADCGQPSPAVRLRGVPSGRWHSRSVAVAPAAWRQLLLGRTRVAALGAVSPECAEARQAIFPGAFNPRHSGHRAMARAAARILGTTVAHELSMDNVDKPPLDYLAIHARISQFARDEQVWLSRAATFLEKAALFPGATFIVGADTVARIAEPRYYRSAPAGGDCSMVGPARDVRDAAIEALAAAGCRFLVFGRRWEGAFRTLDNLALPEPLRRLCDGVSEQAFRHDICSTDLRQLS